MIDTNHTLYDLIYDGIHTNNRFICAENCDNGWQKTQSQQFLNTVHAFALALYDLGIQKSDKIAIHSENRIDWLIADLAITAIGAVTVPIYVSQSIDQIEYILDHSEAKILIVSGKKLADKYESLSCNKNLLAKISFDTLDNTDFKFFDDLIKRGNILNTEQPNLFQNLKSQVTPDDLVTITYTSGTTGTPKGVMLSHRNLAHAIQAPLEKTFLYKNLNKQKDTVVSFLPFTHVFEHCAIYGYCILGIPVYILSNPDRLPQTLETVKPAHFTTVPRLLEKIYQTIMTKVTRQKNISGFLARHAFRYIEHYQFNKRQSLLYYIYDIFIFSQIRKKLGGNIRGITSGGAALSPDIMLFFNAIGVPLGQGYGLSETSPSLTLYDVNNLRLHTAGKAFEGVSLKIADDGEILAKGDNIMQGYFKEPEKTAEVINKEGWFHTGDIGHIDDNGFLFITDRKKELFKLSTGKYVAPAPLENKLITITGVDQVMIVGENEKFCAALIIPITHYDIDILTITIQEALKKINKTVSPWETIKKFTISTAPMTIESGELTPTMKKKRRIILEKRQADIKNMFL